MKHWIYQKLAWISLFLFPQSLTRKIARTRNRFFSCRAAIKMNISHRIHLCTPSAIIGHKYISIGKNFHSGRGLRMECMDRYGNSRFSPSLIIGDNVVFNYRCHVGVINQIIIGNDVLIGSNVLITDHSHEQTHLSDMEIPPERRTLLSKGPVIIEDKVWIGENVCILPNVTIGRSSIIGANSVVTRDVPPFTIVAGSPAKIIKQIDNSPTNDY